jgi:short-subunit dehydrogenase
MKAADARVLLTGASGGIGRAVATALCDAGAAVMLSSRSPAGLAAQVRALAPQHDGGTGVAWHAADLTRSEDVVALCTAARAWGANVLVHAAGVPSFGRLESLRPETIAHALHANLVAPILLTQALLPHLRRQPRAQVICVGSALGRIGLPGFSVYSAGKFGLRGFAEALRRELGDGPVKVQYLGPRSTRTAFNDADVEAYNRATGTAMDPPERVAAALLRLLEDEAAERYLGFPERFAVRLNGFAAPLLDGAFARHRESLPTSPAEAPRADAGNHPLHTAP